MVNPQGSSMLSRMLELLSSLVKSLSLYLSPLLIHLPTGSFLALSGGVWTPVGERTLSSQSSLSSMWLFVWNWGRQTCQPVPSQLSSLSSPVRVSFRSKVNAPHWNCWHIPLILPLGRQRLANICGFKTSLVDIFCGMYYNSLSPGESMRGSAQCGMLKGQSSNCELVKSTPEQTIQPTLPFVCFSVLEFFNRSICVWWETSFPFIFQLLFSIFCDLGRVL